MNGGWSSDFRSRCGDRLLTLWENFSTAFPIILQKNSSGPEFAADLSSTFRALDPATFFANPLRCRRATSTFPNRILAHQSLGLGSPPIVSQSFSPVVQIERTNRNRDDRPLPSSQQRPGTVVSDSGKRSRRCAPNASPPAKILSQSKSPVGASHRLRWRGCRTPPTGAQTACPRCLYTVAMVRTTHAVVLKVL